MSRSNGGLSWSEQWGSRNSNDELGGALHPASDPKQGKKKRMQDLKAGMSKAKVAATSGAEKAKVVASVGAEKAKTGALKVKSGTMSGLKWIKEQYAKRSAKK